MAMTDESKAFKNWINQSVVQSYSQELKKVDSKFQDQNFLLLVKNLENLELKARVILIASALHECLGSNYPQALQKLVHISQTDRLKQFELWPVSEFIRTYGKDHFDLSFQAMKELTSRFTSEFAVRPYILLDPDRALKQMEILADHSNVHVRRWASEGTRPYLPWGEKLEICIQNPKPNLKILEKLRFDPELYVRKSVANHLNDISKNHPTLVIQTLKNWKKEVPADFTKEFKFIVSRALRTLIKNRDPKALQMLGVSAKKDTLFFSKFEIRQPKVKFGSALEFQFEISHRTAKQTQLIIDYAIHFQKANHKLSAKVFKLKNITLKKNETLVVQKKHSIKPITTRRYYPGLHRLEVFANGQSVGIKDFYLTGVMK
ncbi:MAG: DNA alkylation repair protein [Pseudobdellovibrionaceae bacterium]